MKYQYQQKKGQYIIKYGNTKFKNAEIIIKGEFKNVCRGEWNIDLTDKEIEKLMPEEDVKTDEKTGIRRKSIHRIIKKHPSAKKLMNMIRIKKN